MIRLLKQFAIRSWQQYLPSIIAAAIATMFTFLQVTVPSFLNASLQISVAETTSKADANVVQSELERDELIQKIQQISGVETIEANIAADLQASAGNKVISVVGYNQAASTLGELVITAGDFPAAENQILVSQAAAKELKVKVGAQINLIAEESEGPRVSKVFISGIIKRSPLALEPQRFEILTENLKMIAPEAAANQSVSANNMVEVYGNGTISSAELNRQVSRIAKGQVLSAEYFRELEYSNQQNTVDYLQSATRWLFCIPTVFCVFVIFANMRKIAAERQRLGFLFHALGYSWRKLLRIIAAELFLFTFLAAMLGIALGRAFSVLATTYLHNQAIGIFIAPLPPTRFEHYIHTLLLALLLAAASLLFSALVLKVAARENATLSETTDLLEKPAFTTESLPTFDTLDATESSPPQNAVLQQESSPLNFEFSDAADSALYLHSPQSQTEPSFGRAGSLHSDVSVKQNAKQKQRKTIFRRHQAASSRELLGISLVLVSLLISVVIYYVVIIPENFLYISEFNSETANLRSITHIALLLLIGILLCFGTRKFLHRILPAISRKILRRPLSLSQLKFMHSRDIEFSMIALIGMLAATLALATNAAINDLSHGNVNTYELPYQAVVERITPEAGEISIADQEIITELKTQPHIAEVIALNSLHAQIYQDDNLFISDLPIVVANDEFQQFIRENETVGANPRAIPQPGTLVLPNEYAWLESGPRVKTQLAVNLAEVVVFSKPLQIAFADIPWPAISQADVHELQTKVQNQKAAASQKKDPAKHLLTAATAFTAELQQAKYFLLSFDEAGKANLTESYQDLTTGSRHLSNLHFSLSSSPTPLFIRNGISTWITTAMLVTLLGFTLLNLGSAYFAAISSSRKHLRLAYSLGISARQLIKAALLSALGVTALCVVIGTGVGIISGIFLAQEFIGFIPAQFWKVIPWDLAAVILLVSMALVGVTIQIKLFTKPQLFTPSAAQLDSTQEFN